MSGPFAPPVNLVVESSVMSPEEQRRRRTRGDPSVANRERRDADRHGVTRPETEEEFLDLDFASRCAVAGLQLGRTKVFLRREAFDRIEAMRSDKFYGAAATIQKTFRGKTQRVQYQRMKAASLVMQAALRTGLAKRRASRIRLALAATKIQSAWRYYTAGLIMHELVLARRYAAVIIQRAFRTHTNRQFQPSEDDIIRAVVTVQAKHRGSMARKMMTEQARLSIMIKQVSPPRELPPAFASPPRVVV